MILHGGLLYRKMLFYIFPFADILAAGADGEPAAVPADIGQHLGGGFGIDLPNESLIVVFLFLQPEILHSLAVVSLDLFLRVAQVSAQLVGAAGAEGVGGEGELDLRPGTSRSWWTISFMCATKASL